MSRGRIAIVCHPAADPRTAPPGTPPHLVHEEIPPFETALRAQGWEPLVVPIGPDLPGSIARLATAAPAAVLNLCDELPGGSEHEAHLAGALELLGLPYTGAPPLALALCRDKVKAKRIVRDCGLPTPAFAAVDDPGALPEGLRWPLFVKPAAEDGSLGIDDESLVPDPPALRRTLARLLPRFGTVLVEEYVAGREVNVPLLGNRPPEVLPVSEIDFSGLPEGCPRICGYEAKWRSEDARYRGTAGVCPAPLDPEVQEVLARLSRTAFSALGLRDYARVDWRLCPERGPQFLEANPNPDLSPSSGFLRSLRAAGRDYGELAEALVREALSRR